jgi:hypothetical protein
VPPPHSYQHATPRHATPRHATPRHSATRPSPLQIAHLVAECDVSGEVCADAHPPGVVGAVKQLQAWHDVGTHQVRQLAAQVLRSTALNEVSVGRAAARRRLTQRDRSGQHRPPPLRRGPPPCRRARVRALLTP